RGPSFDVGRRAMIFDPPPGPGQGPPTLPPPVPPSPACHSGGVTTEAAAPQAAPTRPTADPAVGLHADEVATRLAGGWANVVTDDQRRTVADIVRSNTLTRFNLILTVLVLVVIATGQYKDALF